MRLGIKGRTVLFVLVALQAPLFLFARFKEPCPELNQGAQCSSMQMNQEQMTLSKLPPDQRKICGELGPMYQRIYLSVFGPNERAQVVVFTRRGISSYQAIDTILKREKRHYEASQLAKKNRNLSPGERAINSSPSGKEYL